MTDHVTAPLARTLNPTLSRRLPRAGNANRTADPTTRKRAVQRPSTRPAAKGNS